MKPERNHWDNAVARCFLSNPGMAYDPAPLPDLDMPVSCMPNVGDLIFDAERGRAADKIYRVISRHFVPNRYLVALIVEEAGTPDVSPFV